MEKGKRGGVVCLFLRGLSIGLLTLPATLTCANVLLCGVVCEECIGTTLRLALNGTGLLSGTLAGFILFIAWCNFKMYHGHYNKQIYKKPENFFLRGSFISTLQ